MRYDRLNYSTWFIVKGHWTFWCCESRDWEFFSWRHGRANAVLLPAEFNESHICGGNIFAANTRKSSFYKCRSHPESQHIFMFYENQSCDSSGPTERSDILPPTERRQLKWIRLMSSEKLAHLKSKKGKRHRKTDRLVFLPTDTKFGHFVVQQYETKSQLIKSTCDVLYCSRCAWSAQELLPL